MNTFDIILIEDKKFIGSWRMESGKDTQNQEYLINIQLLRILYDTESKAFESTFAIRCIRLPSSYCCTRIDIELRRPREDRIDAQQRFLFT